jgi:hypothetical protein
MFGSLGPNMPFQPSMTSHSTNQPRLLWYQSEITRLMGNLLDVRDLDA